MTTDKFNIDPPALVGTPSERLRAAREYAIALQQHRQTRDGWRVTDAHVSRALDIVHDAEMQVQRAAAFDAQQRAKAATPTPEWADAERRKREELAMRGEIDGDPALKRLYDAMKQTGKYD